MTHDAASPLELDRLEQLLDRYFAAQLEQVPIVLDVSRDDELPRRWYVRLEGEARDVTTLWFTLGQRTLKYETYFLPSPVDDPAGLYEFVLRRNYDLVGAQFGIGPEDALFLTGELVVHAIDEDELDRIVGSMWEYVERYWPTALRLGFASML
ncbi:MAG: YbjN domain-containing protein [Actinomycetota bacterium]|jgi:hypothetical protein|nr:YbjN domain-containing protein [Actinomycetota bacterium]